MANSYSKMLKELLEELSHQGWRVEQGTRHYKAYAPKIEQGYVTLGITSSKPRTWDNQISYLRQRGFVWPAPSRKER